MELNHFAVYLKHCKSTILQLKKKKKKVQSGPDPCWGQGATQAPHSGKIPFRGSINLSYS